MASASLPLVDGGFIFHSQHSFLSNHRHSATPYNWGWRRDQETSMAIKRTRGQAFQILANPNVSSGRGGSNKEVIMVDPLEAKRLAAKQMKEIKAKEKFKRRRQIEAINGAWAMIGLTAGLVIEGQTGKSILAQLPHIYGSMAQVNDLVSLMSFQGPKPTGYKGQMPESQMKVTLSMSLPPPPKR